MIEDDIFSFSGIDDVYGKRISMERVDPKMNHLRFDQKASC
jgi:hypothetical protein